MSLNRFAPAMTSLIASCVTPASAATLVTLATFDGSQGYHQQGVLTRDAAGNLYGTTVLVGTRNCGTVFRLTPDGTLSTLLYFNGANDANPIAGMIADATGNQYGTTVVGGTSNLGTVVRLAPGGTLSTLATFVGANGASPAGRLFTDAAGNLYGTNSQGGAEVRSITARSSSSRPPALSPHWQPSTM